MAEETSFRCRELLRVRWSEIDAQNIVFNAHYLTYFDTGIAAYWRALALPYFDTVRALGGDLFLRKASLEYRASARYDDRIEVGVRCERIGTSSLVFRAQVSRGRERLVSGELVYVWADPAGRGSRPVPAPLREAFLGFEAGQPMVDVRTGSWQSLGAPARALREAVFIAEQGVPIDMEWDTADEAALHAVAFNRMGLAVATGRLVDLGDGSMRIGRMAVQQGLRGSGVGRAVLDALVDAARQRSARRVVLNAQVEAIGFYARAGFVAQGAPFDEAGIAHQAMQRDL